MTTTTTLKREEFEKRGLSAEQYLIQVKGYLPRVATGAKVLQGDGDEVILEHKPCPKYRVVLRLDRPWRASNYPDQDQAIEAWRERYKAVAHYLGLVTDPSGADPNRLFFLPRHEPGAPFETLVIEGADLRIGDLPKIPEDHSSVTEPQKPATRKETATGDDPDVIGAFNREFTVEGMLEKHGYRKIGHKYLAPTSSTGEAGVSIKEGRAFSHHSSDPLFSGDSKHSHDAFSVYCILEHKGDQRAAVKAAVTLLGIEKKNKPSEAKAVQEIVQDIPSLKAEIDQLAEKKLDPLELNEHLKPLKPRIAPLPGDEREALLGYMKKALGLSTDYMKELRREITKAAQPADTAKKATATLQSLQTVPRIHPAIDFHEGFMTLGFRVDQGADGDGLLFIVSDGEAVEAIVKPEEIIQAGQTYRVKAGAPPFINEAWSLDQLRAFVQTPSSPKTLFSGLKSAFREYLDLADPAYGLMAAWTVGTYFSQLFAAAPFLHFLGPKSSGKSKTLETLQCVCFNTWKGRDISAAALGDTCDGLRGTILLDQAEKLGGDSEQDNLIGLLADSYKRMGGRRRVVEITKAGRNVLEFSCYGPKAFASQKKLDPDLADRCIRVSLIRSRKPLPDLMGWEPIWAQLRDKLYRFVLTCFKEVSAHYGNIEATGTRIGELWRPIQAVLLSLNVERSEIEGIKTLFDDGAAEGQHELNGWQSILFEVLKQRAEAGQNTFEMTTDDILSAMNIQGESKPEPKWVGDTLSEFTLHSKKLKRRYAENSRNRKVTPYQFDSAHILRLYKIYLRETPLNDVSHVSQDEKECDSDGMNGTDENHGTRQGMSQGANGDHSLSVPGQVGHTGTCPASKICPTEPSENITDSDVGHVGQAKTGGMAQEKIIGSLKPGHVRVPI